MELYKNPALDYASRASGNSPSGTPQYICHNVSREAINRYAITDNLWIARSQNPE
jgi:hypothetical protein